MWLKPDKPSGTPAAAAEMVLPATSASAVPSGSDTDRLINTIYST